MEGFIHKKGLRLTDHEAGRQVQVTGFLETGNRFESTDNRPKTTEQQRNWQGNNEIWAVFL